MALGFKKGTLGYELAYAPTILSKLALGIIPNSLEFHVEEPKKSHTIKVSDKIDLSYDGEPDSEECLRQAGFYDSTDKRCCINRKKR